MARSDAARNRRALLEAARSAFEREGLGASLEGIAREAGVGIGTLYRHFPRRADLVTASYGAEIDDLCSCAPTLIAERGALAGLRAFAARFLAGAELVVAAYETDPQRRIIDRLAAALQELLDACRAEGLLGPADGREILMLLGGLALALPLEQDRHRALALFDLAIDGLRLRAREPGASLSTGSRVG